MTYSLELTKKNEMQSSCANHIPLYSCLISAGFPSPADENIECGIDLNKYLIKHPTTTFLFRMKGEAMIGAGIFANSILLVDRSIEAKNSKIVIAEYNGELVARRYYNDQQIISLFSENKRYFPMIDNRIFSIVIWGVVTAIIHQL